MEGWIPLIAAVVGGVISGWMTLFGQKKFHDYKEKDRRSLEKKQSEMLLVMLNPANMPKQKGKDEKVTWRKFSTLRDVIGTDDETARRLLVNVGARRAANQKNVWALEKNKPLEGAQKQVTEDSEET